MGITRILHLAILAVSMASALTMYAGSQVGPAPATFPAPQVSLDLDKVERVDRLSPSLRQALFLMFSNIVPEPASTDDYMVITLTVKRVMHGHVIGLDTCSLRNAAGGEHKSLFANVGGIQYLENSFSSPYWVVDGAKAALLFQIPKTAKPTLLTFVYQYKEGWDGKSKDQWEQIGVQKGVIEIKLSKD